MTYLLGCIPREKGPTKAEIGLCFPHIEELIKTTNPTGIVYLGPLPEKYVKTKLPTITLTKPSKILAEEFRLLPVIRAARQLQLFIQKLGKKVVNFQTP